MLLGAGLTRGGVMGALTAEGTSPVAVLEALDSLDAAKRAALDAAPAAPPPVVAATPTPAPVAAPVVATPAAPVAPVAAAAKPVTASRAAVIAPPAPVIAPAPPPSAPSAVIAPPAPATAAPAGPPPAPAPPYRKPPIAETGVVDALTPQQLAILKLLIDGLDGQDYFQVLQISQGATPGEIKKAFYRDSRVYHPDRVYHLTDQATKENINDIYKRITEAYYVLRDEQKRKKYLGDINGPDRAKKLRYSDVSEAEQKAEAVKQKEEEFGTNPKARQFFKTALADIASENWQAAERNLKTALTYEPSNAKFKERLTEVRAKIEDSRKSGNSFAIK